jgi:hypothetical protein
MPWRKGQMHLAVPLLISTQQGISSWIWIREVCLVHEYMSKPRGVLQKFSTSCIQYTYHGTNEYLSTTYSLSFLVCVGDVLEFLNLIWDRNSPLYASRSCYWRHHNTVISLDAITSRTVFGVWLYQFAERTVSIDPAYLQTLATKETDLFSAVTACLGLIVFPEPSRSRLDKHLKLKKPEISSIVLLTSQSQVTNFIQTVIVVCFLLGNSPASEFYIPTFRNTLFHLHRQVGK